MSKVNSFKKGLFPHDGVGICAQFTPRFFYYLSIMISSMGLLVQTAGAAPLSHLPMVGAVTDQSVNIWMRTDGLTSAAVQYQPAGGDWSQALTSGSIDLLAENDFTGLIPITGLSAESQHDYRVVLDGFVQPESTSVFKTLTSKGAGTKFSFVFSSCIKYSYGPHSIFEKMAAHQPDFALLIGDNMYIETSSWTEMDLWPLYKDNRDIYFQDFADHIPILTIWDDHDYGINDDDQSNPYKVESRAAFGKYWANPPYVEENGSIYYQFSAGDTEFFMLDTRWNRDPGVTMLGATQLQWLKDQLLASTAKFKFIVSSVPWSYIWAPRTDSWRGFPEERDNLFDFIAQNNIKNVTLFSGDRHVSGAFQIDYPVFQIGSNIQGFYAFSLSPLGAGTATPPTYDDPEVLFFEGDDLYYGLIRVDTTITPSVFQIEYYRGSDDQLTYSLTVQEIEPSLPTILTESLPGGNAASPYNTQSLSAWGGIPPYEWEVVLGSLPGGLSLDPSGVISGTPNEGGAFTFTVEVQDSVLATDSRELSIGIEACDGFDTDGDGLIDEGFPDTDGDGQADCVDPDDDNDGLPDSWEIQYGLDPLDDTGNDGASGDPDGDGFTNLQEYQGGTAPTNPNSKPWSGSSSSNYAIASASTDGGGGSINHSSFSVLPGVVGQGVTGGVVQSINYQADSGFAAHVVLN